MPDHGFARDVKSIDGMLAELDTARRHHAEVAEGVFDSADGHPTRIDIDYSEDAIDDEVCYRISDFATD